MSGAHEAVARTLLVIGVHTEERAFGKHVADEAEKSGIHVLCVDHGLSHKRRYGDFFYHSTFLKELYLQLNQQIQGKYPLVIDLHSGVNEPGRFAEIYCKETGFLDALGRFLKADWGAGSREPEAIRMLKIVKDISRCDGHPKQGYSVCRSFIPETVWAGGHYLYVGLEIYLSALGEGSPEEWRFARRIINCIHSCYRKQKDGCHQQ